MILVSAAVHVDVMVGGEGGFLKATWYYLAATVDISIVENLRDAAGVQSLDPLLAFIRTRLGGIEMIKGIDVSKHNGAVDWRAVAAAGIEFAIIRSSYGKNSKDETFQQNVAGAKAAGLKVGAYHYSYALTVEDAIQEASNCRETIAEAGVLLELPVFFDMEDADGYKERRDFSFDPAEITAMCKAFLDNIGLDCGVYASCSWLTDYIDWRSLGCAVWNAQWSRNDDIKGYMWQYTDSLEINGQTFDGNIKYE
ncbi:MAG: lyc 2 [Sporomusa sp.]|nr:lyc 2 [Sporomusa sp.]